MVSEIRRPRTPACGHANAQLERRTGRQSWFPNRRTPPLRTATHRHAAFEVADRVVHVDLIDATGGSPGFSLRALLVHVDGEFRGSAWIFGCLGGNGYSFPCVARINDALAVYSNYLAGRCDGMPYVHVWGASPPRAVQESETAAQPESLTVRMGTLTRLEFDALRTKHQQFMEEATRELLDRFGEGFFERNNDRLARSSRSPASGSASNRKTATLKRGARAGGGSDVRRQRRRECRVPEPDVTEIGGMRAEIEP